MTNLDFRRLGMLVRAQLRNPEEGKSIFEFGLKNRCKWRPMCYKNQNFRAYFTMQTYCGRANVMAKALEVSLKERIVRRSFLKNVGTVVSFGCGPGSELYGFREYLLETFPYSTRHRDRTRFFGYDTELGWMHYIEEMGFQFFELKNSITCQKLLEDMAAADVILIPFSLRQTEHLNEGLDILSMVMKKAKVVMILDVDECLSNKTLEANGFRHFTVTDPLGTKVHVYCFAQWLSACTVAYDPRFKHRHFHVPNAMQVTPSKSFGLLHSKLRHSTDSSTRTRWK